MILKIILYAFTSFRRWEKILSQNFWGQVGRTFKKKVISLYYCVSFHFLSWFGIPRYIKIPFHKCQMWCIDYHFFGGEIIFTCNHELNLKQCATTSTRGRLDFLTIIQWWRWPNDGWNKTHSSKVILYFISITYILHRKGIRNFRLV